MLPFSNQIGQIIDYMEQFDNDQVRRAYELLCLLALNEVQSDHSNFCGEPFLTDLLSQGSTMNNTLLIFTQKLLSRSTDQPADVIGIISVIKALGSTSSPEMSQQACGFLRSLAEKITQPACRAFMYDELARRLPELSRSVTEFIAEYPFPLLDSPSSLQKIAILLNFIVVQSI